MLIRTIIAVMILIFLSMGTNGLKSDKVKQAISDQELEQVLCIVDSALVQYYTTHAGELPVTLDENTLRNMGLEDYNLSNFNYQKIGKTFTLSVNLSTGIAKISGMSGKNLGNIQTQND